MAGHDVNSFANSLSAKLATRSRHVCAFFGAGIAKASGLPDLAQLKVSVLNGLDVNTKAAFERQLDGGTLEQGLTRLRRVSALLKPGQTFDGLTDELAKSIDGAVCEQIIKSLSLDKVEWIAVDRIAAWAAHSSYLRPLELFTVNYDLLLETALERKKVPYFDGFIGSLQARFYTDFVEASGVNQVPSFYTRLWKLHGSVNWQWHEKDVVRLGGPVTAGQAAAIYPSDAKYEESRRVPFIVLQDRFRRSLNEPETLTIISGYSFGDEHLNELIYDAADKHERSEFIAFCYDVIPDGLAARAGTTPNLQVVSMTEAILSGVRMNWEAPADDKINPDLWADKKFRLADFKQLARYLALNSPADAGVA